MNDNDLTNEEPTENSTVKQTLVFNDIDTIVASGSDVTPNMLVDMARDPNSHSHAAYEWNDAIAGEEYRLVQARRYIHAKKILVQIATIRTAAPNQARITGSVRALLRTDKRNYFRPRKIVLEDQRSRNLIIDGKLTELKNWCATVIDIIELSSLRENIMGMISSFVPTERPNPGKPRPKGNYTGKAGGIGIPSHL